MGLIAQVASKKLMQKATENQAEKQTQEAQKNAAKGSKKLQEAQTPASEKGLMGKLNHVADQMEGTMFNESPEQIRARRVKEAENLKMNILPSSQENGLEK